MGCLWQPFSFAKVAIPPMLHQPLKGSFGCESSDASVLLVEFHTNDEGCIIDDDVF